MGAQAAVNPSEETIRIGPLGIRFLLPATTQRRGFRVRSDRPGRTEAGRPCPPRAREPAKSGIVHVFDGVLEAG